MPERVPTDVGEDPHFLSRQLPSYLGNKRSLLGAIDTAICLVRERVGNRRLATFDPFCGSGAVSRLMKQHSHTLTSADLEHYASALARTYLTNRTSVDIAAIERLAVELNREVDANPVDDGFIRRLYSPADDRRILPGERVFYTVSNARRLDSYLRLLGELDADHRTMLLGPLLVSASVHANTGGVFKGFYKDRITGIGKLGGTNADALVRITGSIRLEPPVLSRFESQIRVAQGDAKVVAQSVSNIDLTYLDPPYNQHPYGSNYFMLNLIATNRAPQTTSTVSGIPTDWQRSRYNVRRHAAGALHDLIAHLDSRFVLISYSDEGFIRPHEMHDLLASFGTTTVTDIRYPTYRASRNLGSRPLHVTEHLYLLERR
ncbi:MAG: DNA adenine methylase [Actinomycetes bacterium]